eukprot:8035341-Prorocentrum_lima.AAC.1
MCIRDRPKASGPHMGFAWHKFRIPPTLCFRPERGENDVHLGRIGKRKTARRLHLRTSAGLGGEA